MSISYTRRTKANVVSSVGLHPDRKVQSSPSPPPTIHVYLSGLALFLLSVALYYPVHTHPWVNYDDNVYVTDNLHVQEGLSWDTIAWAFTTFDGSNWHPLTWLSHALDVQLFGVSPHRHHLTSVFLHALNAALLFWLLLRATGRVGRSFMVAALFAVHPVNVESVVWIAERKTVLSMLFFVLALGAYRWYAIRPRTSRYAVVTLLFALGLMAKPQVITFPFVLLLWDYWPLNRMALTRRNISLSDSPAALPHRRFWDLVVEKVPLLAIAIASAVLTMKAQRSNGAVLSLEVTPLSARLSNALVSYVKYLRNAFWPTKLAPLYPHPGESLPASQVYGALLILVTITALIVAQRRRRYLLVGWLWFLGTMVPMLGLVQVGRQAMADRYAYLPLVGIFIAVCWGLADAAEAATLSSGKPLAARWLPELSAIVLVALSLMARRQIAYWGDNALLWRHTIQVTAPNYIAQDNLGWVLGGREQMDEAVVHFRLAAAINPDDSISLYNIGYYEQQKGDFAAAIEQYQKALILTTSKALRIKTLENMAYAYRDSGKHAEAQHCFDEVSKLEAQ